jgi:hypothetical protein
MRRYCSGVVGEAGAPVELHRLNPQTLSNRTPKGEEREGSVDLALSPKGFEQPFADRGVRGGDQGDSGVFVRDTFVTGLRSGLQTNQKYFHRWWLRGMRGLDL